MPIQTVFMFQSTSDVPAPLRIFIAPPPTKMQYMRGLPSPPGLRTAVYNFHLRIIHVQLEVVPPIQLDRTAQTRQREIENELIAPAMVWIDIDPAGRLGHVSNEVLQSE